MMGRVISVFVPVIAVLFLNCIVVFNIAGEGAHADSYKTGTLSTRRPFAREPFLGRVPTQILAHTMFNRRTPFSWPRRPAGRRGLWAPGELRRLAHCFCVPPPVALPQRRGGGQQRHGGVLQLRARAVLLRRPRNERLQAETAPPPARLVARPPACRSKPPPRQIYAVLGPCSKGALLPPIGIIQRAWRRLVSRPQFSQRDYPCPPLSSRARP